MYQGYQEFIDEYGRKRRIYYRNGYRAAPAVRKRVWRRAYDTVVSTPVLTWVIGVGQELGSQWVQDNKQLRQWLVGGHDATGKTVWCDWFFGTGA